MEPIKRKEMFEKAEIEFLYFESTDIITTSSQESEWMDEF